MQCLRKYRWVKLPRVCLPAGKGIMGAWAKLASRVAFRKGNAMYCGHVNSVTPGMWAGGVVGVKAMLGLRSKNEALKTLSTLSELGYLHYELDPKTKKLTFEISDWVVKCSGEECMDGAVYATNGYGFLCLPRSITERLVDASYKFEEADAWLDLWCHTVWNDPRNAFSYLAPSIQYGRDGAALTLETLGQRWGWEKTKVWRFFRKHGDVFALYRLPGSYGCLIFNRQYPTGAEGLLPAQEEVMRVFYKLCRLGVGMDRTREELNNMISLYSYAIVNQLGMRQVEEASQNRVADSDPIYRAYISPCRNCKICRNNDNDCRGDSIAAVTKGHGCRGPCAPVDLNSRTKEFITYG